MVIAILKNSLCHSTIDITNAGNSLPYTPASHIIRRTRIHYYHYYYTCFFTLLLLRSICHSLSIVTKDYRRRIATKCINLDTLPPMTTV